MTNERLLELAKNWFVRYFFNSREVFRSLFKLTNFMEIHLSNNEKGGSLLNSDSFIF